MCFPAWRRAGPGETPPGPHGQQSLHALMQVSAWEGPGAFRRRSLLLAFTCRATGYAYSTAAAGRAGAMAAAGRRSRA